MSLKSEWSEFDEDRLAKRLDDEIIVIIPKQMHDHIPFFCPVCEVAMNGVAGVLSYQKFACCDWCSNQWAYVNALTWKSGWRPSPNEIKRALEKRNGPSFGINNK